MFEFDIIGETLIVRFPEKTTIECWNQFCSGLQSTRQDFKKIIADMAKTERIDSVFMIYIHMLFEHCHPKKAEVRITNPNLDMLENLFDLKLGALIEHKTI